jgi:hypothetical protein
VLECQCEPIQYESIAHGVSTPQFRSYLYEDLTLNCDSDEYSETRKLAYYMIIIWPVGIPVMYAWLLWSCRKAFRTGHPTRLSRAVAFLADDYDAERGFFWELLDLNRKLVLSTSAAFVLGSTPILIILSISLLTFCV